ncbi:MAG: hypothetical protein ACLFPL_03395 [Candidatus Nanoarchaeia archaeon]
MNQSLLTPEDIQTHYPGVFKIYQFMIEKRGSGLKNHILTHLTRFIKRNQTFVREIEALYLKYREEDSMNHFFKSKVVKQSIKELQRELHTTYSQFQSSQDSKKHQLLESASSITQLLTIHKSTQERVESYQEIYSYLLKQFLSKEEFEKLTILDIGCGMNPLSIEIFEEESTKLKLPLTRNSIKWIGCEVNKEDMNYLSSAYSRFNFKGEFFSCDLTREDDVEQLKEIRVDVLFAFKVLDSLEHIRRNISFEILKELNYNIGVISFATYSLGRRKKIPITKRAWILKFLEREKWTYSIYETDNEAYIVYKKK